MKHIIIQSDQVTEPTLVMVIPRTIDENLQKDIEECIQTESMNSIQSTEICSTPTVKDNLLRYSDVKEYMKENNLKFTNNGEGWELEGDDNDWLFVFSYMIRNSKLQMVDNLKFSRSLEYTLFSSIIGLLMAKGCDLKKPGSTMVGLKHKNRGLVWLRYPDQTMTIVLRKGIYSSVDPENKIMYSRKMPGVYEALDEGLIDEDQVLSSTFGDYPYYFIEDFEYDELEDPDYIRDILRYAMSIKDN